MAETTWEYLQRAHDDVAQSGGTFAVLIRTYRICLLQNARSFSLIVSKLNEAELCAEEKIAGSKLLFKLRKQIQRCQCCNGSRVFEVCLLLPYLTFK